MLQNLITYTTSQGIKTLQDFTNEKNFQIDYLAIFCKDEDEFRELNNLAKELGDEGDIKMSKTGPTYILKNPIETPRGLLKVLKIRNPDPTRLQRGAPDFKVNDYNSFKQKYLGTNGNFTLMPRPDYEMIELKGEDVLVYIPSKCFEKR